MRRSSRPIRVAQVCVGVLVLLACAASLTPLGPAAARAAEQPNIVILFADDAGYGDFGFMDALTGETTEFETPNIDQLASQSTVFSNGYVTSSVCSPSRSGLLTGRYQQKFGEEFLLGGDYSLNNGVPADEVLMMERFQELGYTTGVVGKWHIGQHVDLRPENQGVDEFYGFWSGSSLYSGNSSNPALQIRRQTTAIDWTSEPSFNDIPPDPVNGRYLTDAFGDEASAFVANHAEDANPFFLYLPFSAIHSPYDLHKSADIAEFDDTSLTGTRKTVAAMTYAMDRAVGYVLDRLEDPNGDGDTSDSIADNTIVIFTNDNGGVESVSDNGVLQGGKGSAYEGGIRVPFLMKVPGVAPGTFDQPVSTLDLYPTLVGAAGGEMTTPTDGVDLMPFLEGEQTGQVHETLFWRSTYIRMAVRKGDWKLVRPGSNTPFKLYHLNPDGSGETGNLRADNPEIFWELTRDYVDWEVTLMKPENSTLNPIHRFDSFRQRNDLSTTIQWRSSSSWLNDENSSEIVTLSRPDSYANAVLVFHPRDDADYTSQNNMSRGAGLDSNQIDAGQRNPKGFEEFMLNELRFDGSFAGTQEHSGTLWGFPLMFVNSLEGVGPRITLGSTRTVVADYTFNVDMDIVMYNDLEITGDSDLDYSIGGQIRDFYTPRSLTKTGNATVTLSGNNIYTGATYINGGHVRVEGPSASLDGTSEVQIGPQGELTLVSGLISTGALIMAPGAAFNFEGGVLKAEAVDGSIVVEGGTLQSGAISGTLVLDGGTFSPGSSVAHSTISEQYLQNSGSLKIEVGGTSPGSEFDWLDVSDFALLDDTLEVELVDDFMPIAGQEFTFLTASGGVFGTFDDLILPSLGGTSFWRIRYDDNSVSLLVSIPGDYNSDGTVNAADYTVWRNSLGESGIGLPADGDGDGTVTQLDYLFWRERFGNTGVGSSPAGSNVPEPATGVMLLVGALMMLLSRRRARS